MARGSKTTKQNSGRLSLRSLAQQVQAGNVDTVVAGFSDHYGRLMGKRFDAEFFLKKVASQGTHACDYLLTTDVEMNPTPGYRFANWERGYGDFHLVPDLSTLRRLSWLERTAFVHCDVLDESRGRFVAVAPRSLLRAQVEAAASLGYQVLAASELEFFAYRHSYRQAAQMGYSGLEALSWYLEDYHLFQGSREEFFLAPLRRHLKASGIPVENSKGEWGLGQHEINVCYDTVLEMADNHVLLKQAVKEIAEQLGVSVTFMAKPAQGQAGSGCHLHLSLRKQGQNAFVHRGQGLSNAESDIFRWFLGGWMAHVGEFMVFYAPTVNSYKRYEDLSWAPTRIAWSRDNRTAGFRVVGRGESLRIECRIPGADVNPYLAYAAALASGLDGIRNRIEPPAAFEGDVYSAKELPRAPRTLEQAVALFESSEFVKQALGEDVQQHYAHFYRCEQRAFEQAVTDWERKRYFERI
ncbi:MAG: glutamine synthetase family protein [Bryobacteraceae bacterium]|nr:glutamine synthetase family protein [Bryobacteraceae bacterium]MDW8376849.1 glutamine synthetase family protein [Bryobacterales bacterium]